MKTRYFVSVGLVGLGLLAACSGAPQGAEDIGESSSALTALTSAADRHFDGVDDRVTIPNSAKQQLGTGDFTLEATVKLDSAVRSYEPILSSRTSGSDGFLFVVYGSTLLLQMNGVPNYQSMALPNLRDGKSHHLAVTRSGTTVTFYVDGQAWGNVTSARSTSSLGPLYIGYDAVDNRSLAGSFGEVRLWNVARPASALAEAAKGTAISYSTPGLVGAYAPSSALSQMVVDQSPLHNPGYLGTVAKGWDAQDPMWSSTATLELNAGNASVQPSNPNARVAANPDLAVCGELTVNGVFDKLSGSSFSSLQEATYHYFCDNSQTNFNLALDFAGSITLPIEGIPVKLDAKDKTNVNYQKLTSYCQQDASHMSDVEASSWLSSTADPFLVKAFVDCIHGVLGSSPQPVLQGSQSVSTDGNTIVFNLLAKVLANGQPDTLVVDAYPTGATCTGALTQTGSVVPNAQAASAVCTRTGTGPVSFVVVTTQGTYLFNVGGSGVTGSAWVTGAKQVNTEVTNTKCTDLNVGSRTCLFGACKDTQVSGSFWLDSGYTKFRKESLTLMTSFSSVRDASAWLSDNGTKVNGQYWRQGKHSASMRLCAEEYRTDTTYTSFQSPQVSVYGTKNFEVRVENAYQGKALHVLTTDNNMLLQNLDAPSYAPPFTLVSKVADPLQTTYLVQIDQ